MSYRLAELKKVEEQYVALLKLLSGGDLAIEIFASEGTPIDKIDERISEIEKRISKLKADVKASGINIDHLEDLNESLN